MGGQGTGQPTPSSSGGCLLSGDIRNQIDRIWDAFWSGGISNPLEVIEQITYLLFLRLPADFQEDSTPGFSEAFHPRSPDA
jgi:hypothetical protein